MLKEMQYVIESSLFQQVLIEANIGNMAMHSFFKIMLYSENYNFNILKFSQNRTFYSVIWFYQLS